MDKKISVIIPAYNAANYLPDTIQSIRAQIPSVDEIILMDDGSIDNTKEVISHFRDVSYFWQPNSGTATALNEAMKKASGQYLAFLDADDLWLPGKLNTQLEIFDRNPQLDMVFGGIEQFISPELTEEERSKIEFQSGPMIGRHKSTWMIKRDSFYKVGPFTESFVLEEFMDWYMRAKDMGLTEVVVVQVMAKRRIHTTNISRVKKDLRTEFPKLLKSALDRRRQRNG